ncbi:hypothetical protein E3N88_35099 [Mikania micrantha]|uniref:Uncharacterized protein n=1 Tax=Mikania micrantha TaxID=192012 RepID=A0A5N6M001_9ASTR|nr:hypothetical protein E3N88_35099 [Mikania micrantha]
MFYTNTSEPLVHHSRISTNEKLNYIGDKCNDFSPLTTVFGDATQRLPPTLPITSDCQSAIVHASSKALGENPTVATSPLPTYTSQQRSFSFPPYRFLTASASEDSQRKLRQKEVSLNLFPQKTMADPDIIGKQPLHRKKSNDSEDNLLFPNN